MDEELVDIPVDELLSGASTPAVMPTVESTPSRNELIDATQNVIIDAAENVKQVFDTTTVTPVSAPLEPFYTEVEFWIGIAFILCVLLLLKPIIRIGGTFLRQRIQKVSDNLNEAVKLRDDAQVLLADYQRRCCHVDDEIASMIEQTQLHLQNLRNYETAQMKSRFKTKERDLTRHLEAQTLSAQQEISALAGRRSASLAQKAICNYLQNADKSQLIDKAIDELDEFAC